MGSRTQRTTTAIRFDPLVHASLVEYADATEVSINWLVNRAVRQYLATLPPADAVEMRLVAREASADWADQERNPDWHLHPCCFDQEAAPNVTGQMRADLAALVAAVRALRGGRS